MVKIYKPLLLKLTPQERERLEQMRIVLGFRSEAAVIRKLIAEALVGR